MRKTLSTIVLALGLAVGGTTAAQATAGNPTIPDLPPCAGLLIYHQVSSWPTLESDCGVSFTGVNRQYVNLLEYIIGGLSTQSQTTAATAAAQRSTISAQQRTIAHQRAVIRHLRHRLHSR